MTSPGRFLGIFGACVLGLHGATVSAQDATPLHAGGWIIGGGGSLGRSHDQTSGDDRTFAAFSPTGLRFVNSHLAIGAAVALSYTSGPAGTSRSYGVGPQVRYYFSNSPKTLPFVSTSVTPVWQQTTQRVSIVSPVTGTTSVVQADLSSRFVNIDGSAGVTQIIATHVGVTGEAFYTHAATRTDANSTTSTRRSYNYGFRFGLSVFAR